MLKSFWQCVCEKYTHRGTFWIPFAIIIFPFPLLKSASSRLLIGLCTYMLSCICTFSFISFKLSTYQICPLQIGMYIPHCVNLEISGSSLSDSTPLPETILVWKLMYVTKLFLKVVKNYSQFTRLKWNWNLWGLFFKNTSDGAGQSLKDIKSKNWHQFEKSIFYCKQLWFFNYLTFFHSNGP